MFHHTADFTVFTFAKGDGHPCIAVFLNVNLGLDRPVIDTVNRNTVFKLFKLCLVNPAMDAHTIPACPAGGRQFKITGKLAIIGQQQKTFGIQIKPPDGNHARHIAWQMFENRIAALLVTVAGDQPAFFKQTPQARLFLLRQRFAIDVNFVFVGDGHGRAVKHLAVQLHQTFLDHAFGVAPRTNAGTRNALGNAFGFAFFGIFCRVRGLVAHLRASEIRASKIFASPELI